MAAPFTENVRLSAGRQGSPKMFAMDAKRSKLPTQVAKEEFSKALKQCQEKIQYLSTLQQEVDRAIEEDCMAIGAIISDAENISDKASPDEIKAIFKELRRVRAQVSAYGKALCSVGTLACAVKLPAPIDHAGRKGISVVPKQKTTSSQDLMQVPQMAVAGSRQSQVQSALVMPLQQPPMPEFVLPAEFIEGTFVQPGRFSFGANNSVQYFIRQIISPDEFYVEPKSIEPSTDIDSLRQAMLQFYSNPQNRKSMFHRDAGQPLASMQGLFCVCCIGDWRRRGIERGQITRLRSQEPAGAVSSSFEVEVLYLDLGFKEWIPVSQVWLIEQRFCNLPAKTIHCRLFDVQPKMEGGTDLKKQWSPEAIEKFKSLCIDGPMEGCVMSRQEPFKLIAYGQSTGSQICINATLVQDQYARSLTNWNRADAVSRLVGSARMD